MSDIADKLKEAKALIERGWCKGYFESGDGSYCADGALSHVADSGQYGQMAALLKTAIGSKNHSDIWSWNDSRENKGEVLSAFDKAIELAEQSA